MLFSKIFQDGRGHLWEVCCKGHIKIGKLLIDAGADVNAIDKVYSVLYCATFL